MTTNRLDEVLQMKLIANNLRNLRKAAGLTTTEAADAIDKTRQAYNNYEKGSRLIGVIDLIKLSELYNIPMSSIVGSKITDDERVSIPFDHYEIVNNEIIKSVPLFISTSNDDIILLTKDEDTIDYYLKTQDFHEKIETLFSYNDNIYSSILFKSKNGTISFTVDKELKHIPREFVSNIIILGIHAGTIKKEISVPDFF